MTDLSVDPRPLDDRPEHWYYGCAPQLGYDWNEWVAMSELMIGPEQVSRNDDGRVTFVNLSDRKIADEKLRHLTAFPFLSCVNLSSSSVTDKAIPHLLNVPQLKRVYTRDSAVTLRGEFKLRSRNVKVGGDSPFGDEVSSFVTFALLGLIVAILFALVCPLLRDWVHSLP